MLGYLKGASGQYCLPKSIIWYHKIRVLYKIFLYNKLTLGCNIKYSIIYIKKMQCTNYRIKLNLSESFKTKNFLIF